MHQVIELMKTEIDVECIQVEIILTGFEVHNSHRIITHNHKIKTSAWMWDHQTIQQSRAVCIRRPTSSNCWVQDGRSWHQLMIAKGFVCIGCTMTTAVITTLVWISNTPNYPPNIRSSLLPQWISTISKWHLERTSGLLAILRGT